MEFEIFGTKVLFKDDLKKYYKLMKFFREESDNLLHELEPLLKDKNNLKKVVEKITQCIEKDIKNIIAELSKFDIYNLTVEDFLKENSGYNILNESIRIYLEFLENINQKGDEITQNELNKAKKTAESQITGLDYGVISSSLVAHLMYASQNDRKVKKQIKEAEQQYNKEASYIIRKFNYLKDLSINEFYRNKLIPTFKESIKQCYLDLFSFYANELTKCNQLDIDVAEQLNFERSNSLLDNIDVVEDKKKLFKEIIQVYPFNQKLYEKLFLYDLFDNEILNLVKYFEIENEIIDYLINSEVFINYKNTEEIKYFIENNKKLWDLFTKFTSNSFNYYEKLFTKDIYLNYSENIKKIKEFIDLTDEEFYKLCKEKFNNSQENFKRDLKKYVLKDYRFYQDDIDFFHKVCHYDSIFYNIDKSIESLDDLYKYLNKCIDTKIKKYVQFLQNEQEKQRLEQENKKSLILKKFLTAIIFITILIIPMFCKKYIDNMTFENKQKKALLALEEYKKNIEESHYHKGLGLILRQEGFEKYSEQVLNKNTGKLYYENPEAQIYITLNVFTYSFGTEIKLDIGDFLITYESNGDYTNSSNDRLELKSRIKIEKGYWNKESNESEDLKKLQDVLSEPSNKYVFELSNLYKIDLERVINGLVDNTLNLPEKTYEHEPGYYEYLGSGESNTDYDDLVNYEYLYLYFNENNTLDQ